jgi:hypothetical protein
VVVAAARISDRLRRIVERADDGVTPIAEIWRRVGAEAERLGVARPSYEAVRLIVHDRRERYQGPSTAQVAVEVAYRARPPEALLDHVAGIGLPRL